MPAPEAAKAIKAAEPVFGTLDCDCHQNSADARWEDDMDPAGRITALCASGGGCYQAQTGRMCVNGDLAGCSCAIDTAKERQYLDGNGSWWLKVCQKCGLLISFPSPFPRRCQDPRTRMVD
jgi:hypothetical protein